MERPEIQDGLFNVGRGLEVSIRELANTVMDVVGFKGKIVLDVTKPDGTHKNF
jgi:GDP-L-fucose synthase